MRANRSKTGMRRSHAAIHGARTSKCECGAMHLAHRACVECGKYNDRVVIDVVERAKREQRRLKKRTTELKESGKVIEDKEREQVET